VKKNEQRTCHNTYSGVFLQLSVALPVPQTHTHTQTYTILFNINCCRIAQTHAQFLTCAFLEGKKVTHDSQILLNTTQTAFGIMYAGNYVTCIYISLSTKQACSHTHAHTYIHLKVAATLLHNLCIS